MLQLFIANCTKQNYDLHYRVPEVPAPRNQPLPAGGQLRIAGDLSSTQIDSVVKHFVKRYGMIDAASIKNSKTFVGLCYSDKRIDFHTIGRGLELNDKALTQLGQEIRRKVAVATNASIDRAVKESGLPETLGELEVSMTEVDPKTGKPIDGGILESTTVSAQASERNAEISNRPIRSRENKYGRGR